MKIWGLRTRWGSKNKKTVFAVWAVVFGLCLAATAYSAPKLIVKNGDGSADVFTVDSTGDIFAGGTDAVNAFQFLVSGHTGGASHLQLTTNQTNSRISLIASSSNDFAPRFQAVGPQDTATPGWVVFDYGSNLFDLPSAEFRLRHYSTSGVVNMIRIIGENTVLFPTGNVGIGVTSPTHLLQVGAGAYSDGTGWYPACSRAYKENIKDLSVQDAVNTLMGLTPVTYNYKVAPDKERAGFIAEDVPDLVGTKDRKSVGELDVTAVLTKVVQEQQRMIAELKEKVAELQREVKMKNGFASLNAR
ncbi:MAG: tail fiber domain-containing protein [Candidatus Sulfobium sp.]